MVELGKKKRAVLWALKSAEKAIMNAKLCSYLSHPTIPAPLMPARKREHYKGRTNFGAAPHNEEGEGNARSSTAHTLTALKFRASRTIENPIYDRLC